MLTRSRSQSRERSIASSDSQSSGYSSAQSQSQDDSAPKDDYAPKKKKARGRVIPVQPDQWLCLMPKTICASCNGCNSTADSALSFASLCDPRTGSNRRYLWKRSGDGDGRGDLCEVIKFSDEPRSWFVDNSIQSDGSLFLCTPIDPLFLALPYLMKTKSGKFTTLEVMLEDGGCKDCHVLNDCVQTKQWQHVCDYKAISDEVIVYKFNKDKALSWLRAKVEAQASSLEENKVYVGTGSQSSVLVRSNKRSDHTKEEYVGYACGMVGEYLPKELASDLERCFKSELEMEVSEPPAKRAHLDNELTTPTTRGGGEPLEDYTKMESIPPLPPPVKAGKMSATQRALAKVDKKGMKSITSFFTPKK